MNRSWDNDPRIAGLVARTEQLIEAELSVQDGIVIPSRHAALAPGAKRARPRLLFQMATVAETDDEMCCQAAAAIESIHTASLIHDDVVDEGDMRRGRPTAHVLYGNAVAVLSGDLLLSRALQRIQFKVPALLSYAIETVCTMSRAAYVEIVTRGHADIPLATWDVIAEGKTAVLFALCGRAAGLIAGRPELAESLSQIGRHLGLAFQIQDDLSDLTDTSQGCFRDIIERNVSYPVIAHTLRDPAFAARLASAWSEPRVDPAKAEALGREILAGPGIAIAQAEVQKHIEAVETLIDPLRPSPALEVTLAWAATLAKRPEPLRAQIEATRPDSQGRPSVP